MDRLTLVIALQILALVYPGSALTIIDSGQNRNGGPSFSDLQNLHKYGDRESFYDAIHERLGKQEFDLEGELPKMFNEVNNAQVPDELEKKGFEFGTVYAGNFTYTDAFNGSSRAIHYGLFEDEGTSGLYTSLFINFINQTIFGIEDIRGSFLLSRVKYTRKGAALEWEGATAGSFYNVRNSSGRPTYQEYGKYAAVTKARVSANKGLKEAATTLATSKISSTSSKSVTNLNGQYINDAGSFEIDMVSDTGRNLTLTGDIALLEGFGSGFNITMNGTLKVPGSEITMNRDDIALTLIDTKDKFGKANLHSIFSSMYATVGLNIV